MKIQETAGPAVRLENVCMRYQCDEGETEALDNVSFEVERGEFVSVVGPSGCGKSTVLSLISGLLTPVSGSITVNGKPRGRGIDAEVGYMLQRDCLLEWRTVLGNALLGLEVTGKKTPEAVNKVLEMLTQYGLGEFIDSYPAALSGGMRQRVALIRTLAPDPEPLLLDEPFSALDYQSRIRVSMDISGIIRSRGKTALMVTHDISEAISLSDRVIVLTERPARVKKIYRIELDTLDGSLTGRRQAQGFADYFNRIWGELNNA